MEREKFYKQFSRHRLNAHRQKLSIVIMNGTLSKICSVFKVDQYIFGYKYLKKTIISTKVVSTDKAT